MLLDGEGEAGVSARLRESDSDEEGQPRPWRYAYALISGFAAATARLALAILLGYQHQYALFYLAVLWTSWYGGLRPALLTTAMGVLAAAFFQVQGGRILIGFHPANLSGLEFYCMVTVTAMLLFEGERRARRRAAANARVAGERLARMQREIGLRKAAEAAASQAEEQFRLTVEHAPAGICRLSLDGRFEEVNPQFCAITGYAREELLGLGFREITHPADLAAAAEGYASLRDGARPFFNLEKRDVRKDGHVVWVGLTAAVVRSADNRPQFLLTVSQDVTRRKEAEDQIREAQRLESVGLLAGGIAHDFNNLLTGVLGNASLAIDTVPPEGAARQFIDSIVTAAERASQLTRQLLAYAGKGNFFVAPVDLSEMVRRSSELIRVTVPPQIDLRLELQNGLPPLTADPSQIQQLITNLAINSVEAIGDRRGTVAIRTALVHLAPESLPAPAVGNLHSGEYLCLEVEDTGCGVPEGSRRRIFEPFFTTKFMGRGLGLAAVAGIVRTLNGAVVVRSQARGGTAMQAWIPKPDAARGAGASEPA